MYARVTAFGVVATMLMSLHLGSTGRYDLDSTGAVTLKVTGPEAKYGVVPAEVNGRPLISVSLGATSARGSVTLSVLGSQVPAAGRYQVVSWDGNDKAENVFHATFVAGSVEKPAGWFQGQSGWVRITEKAPSHICGEFEIQGRGFLATNPDDENKWVTVRGRFQAQGDRTVLQDLSIQ